ncbi:MAG: hypothetical protein AAGA73_00450 [Pseudomonadota bacterium]
MTASIGPPLGSNDTIPSAPISPPVRPPEPTKAARPILDGRRSATPEDGPQPGRSGSTKDSVSGSLEERVIGAIRPMLKTQTHCRPVRLRASLARLQEAIHELDIIDDDPLMRTAYVLLAEEQLRVEMLRQRLQMVLEG